MPCYDPRPDEDAIRNKRRVDQLTAWLCSVLGALDAMGIDITKHDPALGVWWQEHKAFDEARKGKRDD